MRYNDAVTMPQDQVRSEAGACTEVADPLLRSACLFKSQTSVDQGLKFGMRTDGRKYLWEGSRACTHSEHEAGPSAVRES